jgi:Subtilase family
MADRPEQYEVTIGAYRFDPRDGPRDVPASLRADVGEAARRSPKAVGWYVVQFVEPVAQAQAARLSDQFGLRLSDYVPNLSFLERLEPDTLRALDEDALVRAIVPYEPAFKLDPAIGTVPPRTDARRAAEATPLEAILFDEADPAPVVARLAEIGAGDIAVADDRPIGGRLRVRFKLADLTRLEELALVEGVQWIAEIPEVILDDVAAAGTNQSGAPADQSIWDQGLHGEGQVIGVIDQGPVDIGHCFFRDPVNNAPRADHRKVRAVRNATPSPPGDHATFVSGCAAGDDFANPGTHQHRGGAWAAKLVSGNFADMTGARTLLDELTDAAAAGATIHTNSWHDATGPPASPATYNQNAADVDTFTFTNEDHVVLGSAGNTGGEQGPPGTAKNAICVACAREDPNEMALGSGNPGPTADGRRKPDVCGVGCVIRSALVGTACGAGPYVDQASGAVVDICATSWATPHVAAAAALVRQYMEDGWYPDGVRVAGFGETPSGALIKAMLINSTLDMTSVPGYPSNDEGWGLIRLENVLVFPSSPLAVTVWDRRHARGLANGDTRGHPLDIVAGTQQLKVTLVWTDPPGVAGMGDPVVNDLNLRVTSPAGQTFLGNNFAAGVSAPGGAADVRNPVEVVVVPSPATGRWTITVSATRVRPANPTQGYAVVATAVSRRCFVATALYGSRSHPDVALLRAWRDAHLAPGRRGRLGMCVLISLYDRLGPPLAGAVGRRPALATALRRCLIGPLAAVLRRRRQGRA